MAGYEKLLRISPYKDIDTGSVSFVQSDDLNTDTLNLH